MPSYLARTASAVRALVVALGISVVVAFTGATASAPAAEQADETVFGGLGTWVDIYDGRVLEARYPASSWGQAWLPERYRSHPTGDLAP